MYQKYILGWSDNRGSRISVAMLTKTLSLYSLETSLTLATYVLIPTEDGKEFAEKENFFFMVTSVLDATIVEFAFLTTLTEIYHIASKKSLVANDGPKSGSSSSLFKGTKIVVLSQEPIAKSECACRSVSWTLMLNQGHLVC